MKKWKFPRCGVCGKRKHVQCVSVLYRGLREYECRECQNKWVGAGADGFPRVAAGNDWLAAMIDANRTSNRTWCHVWHLVYTGAEHLDLADKPVPVAAFKHLAHAREFAARWGGFAEIKREEAEP